MKNITLLIIVLGVFFLSFNSNNGNIKRYDDTFFNIYYIQNKNIISVSFYSIFQNGDSLQCPSYNQRKCIRRFNKYDILKRKEVFNTICKNQSSLDLKERRKLKLLFKQVRKTHDFNLYDELNKAGFNFVFIQSFYKEGNVYTIDYHRTPYEEIVCFPTRLIAKVEENKVKILDNKTGIYEFPE